ncbi:MAG: ROK family protein [Hydrogenothermaceae bacterium]|nr:ROK family protein [Hydrogenothermaceae bacterium]
MKVLGVDIGGTFVKIILKDGDSVVKEKIAISEDVKEKGKFEKFMLDTILKYSPQKVGIAVAGLVNKEGVITNSPNLRYIEGINLKVYLQNYLNIPVFVGNDANFAAYGEYIYGNGKGSKILICLTLGTGLGGGTVIDGRIVEGVSGSAMEIGHMIIEKGGKLCNCGRRGCLEAYVSSYGLERIYREISGEDFSSFDIIKLAKEGDIKALNSFDIFIDYLSVGVMNIAHIFNPDKVLLSGGIVENYPQLLPKLRKIVKRITFPLPAKDLTIDSGLLGSWSGSYGALAVAENHSS